MKGIEMKIKKYKFIYYIRPLNKFVWANKRPKEYTEGSCWRYRVQTYFHYRQDYPKTMSEIEIIEHMFVKFSKEVKNFRHLVKTYVENKQQYDNNFVETMISHYSIKLVEAKHHYNYFRLELNRVKKTPEYLFEKLMK